MLKHTKYFDSPDMRETLKRFMRTQMTLKNIKYKELSERLAKLGVNQEEAVLRTKINKGNLGAPLFAFILIALDMDSINIKDLQSIYQSVEKDNKSK